MITIPTKEASYDPENIKFFHNLSHFCFGINNFPVLLSGRVLLAWLPKCNKRKVVSGSRVTLPVNFASPCKPGLSFHPLARVTLAVALPYLLVKRALGRFKEGKKRLVNWMRGSCALWPKRNIDQFRPAPMKEGPEAPAFACFILMNTITLAKPVSKKMATTSAAGWRKGCWGWIVFLGNAAASPFDKTKNWSITKRLLIKKIALLQTFLRVSGKIFFVLSRIQTIIYVDEKLLNISWNLTGCITGVFPP